MKLLYVVSDEEDSDKALRGKKAILEDRNSALKECKKWLFDETITDSKEIYIHVIDMSRAVIRCKLDIRTDEDDFDLSDEVRLCMDSRSGQNRGPYCSLPSGHQSQHVWDK